MTNFFKIKKKPYFGVIFVKREFSLKTLAKNNCSGTHHLNVKDGSRLALKPKIIPSLSACKNHSINLFNSSNHF